MDGGASVNGWLMQYQSDMIGVPVERPDIVETTAMGAAGLAGIAAGVWKDAADFMAVGKKVRFYPEMSDADRSRLREGWNRAIRSTLFWANDKRSMEKH